MFRTRSSISAAQLSERLGLTLEEFLAIKETVQTQKGIQAFSYWIKQHDPEKVEWYESYAHWYRI